MSRNNVKAVVGNWWVGRSIFEEFVGEAKAAHAVKENLRIRLQDVRFTSPLILYSVVHTITSMYIITFASV